MKVQAMNRCFSKTLLTSGKETRENKSLD